MAKTLSLRFRSFLPGGGVSASGAAKQGKTNTRGVVTMVDYTKGGVDLTPSDLGLTSIDDLRLTMVEPIRSGGDPTFFMRDVVYSHTAQQFYAVYYQHDFNQFYVDVTGAGKVHAGFFGSNESTGRVTSGQWRELIQGDDFTFSWDAFGDSAHDIELT